jgi:hypothetical protein
VQGLTYHLPDLKALEKGVDSGKGSVWACAMVWRRSTR